MHMKLETRPGGRWYRDLGDENGHLWGHVQAIKRHTLLELSGPLFMSQPVNNNVQYRLEASGDHTTLRLVHSAYGPMPEGLEDGMTEGWTGMLGNIESNAS